jgi:hypothetical protein
MISNGNLDEVPDYIKTLAASIKATNGRNESAIQVLPKSSDGYYVAVSGNSRLLAIKYLEAIGEYFELKYETRQDLLDPAKRLASRFIENHARNDVSAFQKAYEISQLKELLTEEMSTSEEKPRKIAANVTARLVELTGLQKATLSVYLNFDEFSEVLKAYVMDGKIELYAAYAVHTSKSEDISKDLSAMMTMAIANGKSQISQSVVKKFYGDVEQSLEDTKKIQKAIERSAPALQVAAEDGEVDFDLLALAQVESEATGIPTEQILENVQSDPETKATETQVKATAEKLKNRAEEPQLSRRDSDKKIELNISGLEQLKLSVYDAEGLAQVQSRVAGLLKAVSGLVATDEAFVSGVISLLASTLPANDEAASTLASIYDRGFDGINAVKTAKQKTDDAQAKAERIAEKARAKEKPQNDVKPTESKAKGKRKKSIADAAAEEANQ